MVKCPISKWLHQGGYELDEGEDSTRYGFEVMLVGGMPVAVHRKGAKVVCQLLLYTHGDYCSTYASALNG